MSGFLLTRGASGRRGIEPSLLPEHVGGSPPRRCRPVALLSPACGYKGLHSQWSRSVFLTWPHVALAPQVQLFHEQNPSGESLLEHHDTCEALALLNSTSIAWLCFLKAQKWDSPINRMWGGKDADLGWLLHWGGVQQSTRGTVTIMKCILNTHCAVLTTNSLHSG